MTKNQIDYAKLKEDERANLVRERQNEQQMEIAARQAAASGLQAQAAMINAGVNQERILLDEAIGASNIRLNEARAEYEIGRAGREERQLVLNAQEVENNRLWRSGSLRETVRHDVSTEANQLLVAGMQTDASRYSVDTQASTAASRVEAEDLINRRNNWFGVANTIMNNHNRVATTLLNVAGKLITSN